MAAAMGIISGSANATQSELSDKQKIEQYRTDRNMALYNAKVSRVQAEDVRRRARFEAVQLSKGQEMDLSMIEAIIGASGGDNSVGSNLAAIGEQASQHAFDLDLLFFDSEADAQRYESQAALDDMDAEAARQAGDEVEKMQPLNSLTAFLGGGGSAAFQNIGGGRNRIEPKQTTAPKKSRSTILSRYQSPRKNSSGGFESWRY